MPQNILKSLVGTDKTWTSHNNAKPCISWFSYTYGRKGLRSRGEGQVSASRSVCLGSGAASFLSWWHFTLWSLLCCGLVCWTSGFYPCLSIWTYGDIMFSNSSLYGPVNSVTAHYTDISLTWFYLNKTPIYVSNSQGVWELGRQRTKDSGSGIKFLYSEFCLPLECC